MRVIITLLISLFSLAIQATNHTATVTGGNVNNLTNAQSTYSLVDDDTLTIPNTANGYVGVGNITASVGHTIYIHVPNNITIYQLEIANMVRVKIISPNYGITITTSGRAFLAQGRLQYLTISGLNFLDCTDYLFYWQSDRTYNGDLDSTNHDIIIDSFKIHRAGFADIFKPYGAGKWRYVEIRNGIIDSVQGGRCFNLEKFYDSHVHHLRFKHVGYQETAHTEQIWIRGNGDFHHIFSDSCWGDQFRVMGTSLVSSKAAPMGDIHIYRNMFLHSRKYGQVEVNLDVAQMDTSSVYLRPTNHYIDFNTAGYIPDSAAFWYGEPQGGGGVQLAIYKNYGIFKFRGNISWTAHADHGQGLNCPYWYLDGDGSPLPSDTTGTVYYPYAVTVIEDSTTGEIKASFVGTHTAPILDYDILAFNEVQLPGRGERTSGAWSKDGIDCGVIPTIKRRNKLIIHKN